MNFFPAFREITNKKNLLDQFAADYYACTGDFIPPSYLREQGNQTFAFFSNRILVGGFVLGNSRELHMLNRRAAWWPKADQATELVYFWIGENSRGRLGVCIAVIVQVAWMLLRYGKPYLLFSTASRHTPQLLGRLGPSLRLYRDPSGQNIFSGTRQACLWCLLKVLWQQFKFPTSQSVRMV